LVVVLGGSNDAIYILVKRNTRVVDDKYRIQSRRLFFFKNFLVRYLRYLLEKGMLEVTVILVLPTKKSRSVGE